MAGTEYVGVYPYSEEEANRLHQWFDWHESFRANVACAYEIDQTLAVTEDIGASSGELLEKYGFKRICFVLANTVKHLSDDDSWRIRSAHRDWLSQVSTVPADKTHNRHFSAGRYVSRVDYLIGHVQDAYHARGMFDRAHCSMGMYDGNVEGKVLILSPDTLKESAWSPEKQVWLANGGFGCDPNARGRAIYATCLGDGEHAYWNREDFAGVLDEQYLPEWAKEKLEALRGPRQEQAAALGMGDMKMG